MNVDALAIALGATVDELIALDPRVGEAYYLDEAIKDELIDKYIVTKLDAEGWSYDGPNYVWWTIRKLPGYEPDATDRMWVAPDPIFVAYSRVYRHAPAGWIACGPLTEYELAS